MPENFRCDRCEREYMRLVAQRMGKNAYVDTSRMISRCRIPLFSHNQWGHPVVYMWDCKNKRTIMLSQADYERKRRMGEL